MQDQFAAASRRIDVQQDIRRSAREVLGINPEGDANKQTNAKRVPSKTPGKAAGRYGSMSRASALRESNSGGGKLFEEGFFMNLKQLEKQ